MTVYWIDADLCIQIKNERTGAFPFSQSAGFWAFLSHKVDQGIVKAPKMVYDEIVAGNDELGDVV